LGTGFYPLILEQIENDGNPFDLSNEFFMEHPNLQMANFHEVINDGIQKALVSRADPTIYSADNDGKNPYEVISKKYK
jgi:hypothetical protein